MATIEAFDTALTNVLTAKKVSQSKMGALIAVALDCMANDVQMVTSLYRARRGLSTSAKGTLLYAVDALVRRARSIVVKNKVTGNPNAGQGNCATFLYRIEGILEGLFQDLVSSGSNELKEKAKKILDIWTAQHTFSSTVLSPLYAMLKEAEKEKDKEPTTNTDTTNVASSEPSAPALPPANLNPAPQPPIVPPVDVSAVQSTLMALLSKASSLANPTAPAVGQIAPNTFSAPPPAAPAPVLDASQLALLQQLAQTAQGNAVPAQPVPVPASVVPTLTAPNAVVPVVPPVQGPPQPQPFPYRDDHYGAPASAPQRESEHDRFDGPERGRPRDDYNDPRRGSRGGPRDRGRGARGRGRWDDRDRFREQSREFSRDARPRRSRSRSPPGRYGGPGPRDARPHSPPPHPGRRGGYGQHGQRPPRGYGPGASAGPAGSRREPEAGKDEFGRDLRLESPRDSDTASVQAHQPRSASPLPPGTGSVTTSDRGSVASENAYPVAARGAAADAPPYQQQTYPDALPHTQSYPDALPHQQSYPAGPSASPSLSPSTSTAPLSPVQHRPGQGAFLEGFDRASFDPADPASWERLGKAWMAAYGTMPTQEQLMQFIMGGVAPSMPQQAQSSYGAPPPQQQQQQYYQRQQQSPPPQQPPSQQYPQPFEESGQRQWGGPDRPQRNNRGGWRGGPRDGGAGREQHFGGPGRARGRGRGDFGRGGGGFGRGDAGRRGFDRDDRGRAQYGRGNGRGAYSAGGGAGFHEQETDAVVLSGGGGGGDEYAWREQPQAHAGPPPMYGQQQQQQQGYQDQPPPPAQPRFRPPQEYVPPSQPPQAYNPPAQPSQEAEGGGSGGGPGGRMQKVGDKWVFVRGAA